MSYLTDVDRTLTHGRRPLRRSMIRWPDGEHRPVDGCRWCGHRLAYHGLVFTPGRPGHAYEQPTASQQLARIAAIQAGVRGRSERVAGEIVAQRAGRHAASSAVASVADVGLLQRLRAGLEAL
ncbi:hypothetical protein [Microtetraspora malaysiensis]|uniref:hypothetical protein n=1 Tax=Microtetraspora malaysiensis TaxID=161358 RepID=UPI003D8E1F5C